MFTEVSVGVEAKACRVLGAIVAEFPIVGLVTRADDAGVVSVVFNHLLDAIFPSAG